MNSRIGKGPPFKVGDIIGMCIHANEFMKVLKVEGNHHYMTGWRKSIDEAKRDNRIRFGPESCSSYQVYATYDYDNLYPEDD
jgi:hypothetical protein